jgi:hypothetical protein
MENLLLHSQLQDEIGDLLRNAIVLERVENYQRISASMMLQTIIPAPYTLIMSVPHAPNLQTQPVA